MHEVFEVRRLSPLIVVVGLALSAGCHEQRMRSTDRRVHDAIADRQLAALGLPSDADVDDWSATGASGGRMYRLNPRPIDSELPDCFDKPAETPSPKADDAETDGADAAPDASLDEVESAAPAQAFDLRRALAYANAHARDLQNAKEDLYLAALGLTLERHLWTPQFSASLTSEYEDFEQDEVFDQALTTVAEVAVRQRLPLGGEIAARAVASFVNDLNEHVTTGESGQLILEADIPLFRGAGRVAYESRYVAERELIYAVRSYERFRRSFLVTVASTYFNVQQRRTAIRNTEKSYRSLYKEWEKAEFIERVGRSRTVFDAPRALSSLRGAEVALARANEDYETAMDRFKILLGMPVTESLDVPDQTDDQASESLERLLSDVPLEQAVETALAFRLDLLNSEDRVDDVRRGVVIAENRILPDLDFSGRLVSNSGPDHLSTTTLSTERTSWAAGLRFRIDDRRTEISAYRTALIDERRAVRNHEEFRDQVRADVRRALRRIAQTATVRTIQEMNVEENATRLEAAKVQFALGKQTNQDVVDAENDLLNARNDYADAVAAYRISILEFRRDTGTMRISEAGGWGGPGRLDDSGDPGVGP